MVSDGLYPRPRRIAPRQRSRYLSFVGPPRRTLLFKSADSSLKTARSRIGRRGTAFALAFTREFSQTRNGGSSLSSNILFKERIQSWQIAVCAGVCTYLALGLATNTVRAYHWFMLVIIPAALMSAERGRRFFMNLTPLFAFWLVYDRLRLVQPLLYARVMVKHPFDLERWAFGWLANGSVPAHAASAWLSGHSGALVRAVEWIAQIVYFSHLFVVPLVILSFWALGYSRERYRGAFCRHLRAFTLLNFAAIVVYLLLPVAPPWWVTLNGMARPTAELVAQVNIATAMPGTLIQGMIRNASQWFAAMPSLHGAYPVLLLLLFPRKRNRLALAGIGVYACAMWTATIVLNQHYVIDLVAGALLALAAWWAARHPGIKRIYRVGL